MKTSIWSGRVWVHQPSHVRATNSAGYVKRAVLVAEKMLGRALRPEEDVHHKDGDRMNDTESNLEVLTHSAHARLHVQVAVRCLKCGGKHKGRGLCASCYGKVYRRGEQMPLEPTRGNRWTVHDVT